VRDSSRPGWDTARDCGHAGTAGNDADLFLGEDFGPRVVDIEFSHDVVGTGASGLVRRLSGTDGVNGSSRLAVLLASAMRCQEMPSGDTPNDSSR
jgi:hypothetical protein